jgi:glycosyltransferase involved in cell wall biosynthesis
MIQYSQLLHNDFVSGRRKAIGWGLPRDIRLKIMQLPYSLSFMIDGLAQEYCRHDSKLQLDIHHPDVLKELDADEWGIIVFSDLSAHGDSIRAQLECYPGFSHTLPETNWKNLSAASIEKSFSSMFNRLSKQYKSGIRDSVCLYIHQLIPGGAEKQIYYLALGLRLLNYTVSLVSNVQDAGACVTWSKNLADKGVRRHYLEDLDEDQLYSMLRSSENLRQYKVLRLLGGQSLSRTLRLSLYLRKTNPEQIISYLDDANIIAAISGLLAGIPKILLSGRNLEPNHFPSLQGFCVPKEYLGWFYSKILATGRAKMTNNSKAGASSYAKWLGLPESDIAVIENALFSHDANNTTPSVYLDLGQHPKVLLGVMRLSEEKRPHLWLDTAIELCRQQSDWQAILIGDGQLMSSLVDRVRNSDYSERIKLLGEVSAPELYMRKSTVLLHTARAEGTPNVILEAQVNALPFLCFKVGGIEDIVSIELHKYCFTASSDLQAICKQIDLLIQDTVSTMFLLNQEKIRARYDIKKLAINTISLNWEQNEQDI